MLDNPAENVVLGWGERGVAEVGLGVAVAEDSVGCALVPCHVYGGVESLLDVGAVEVNFSALGREVTLILLDMLECLCEETYRIDDAKLSIKMRASIGDVVDVEARVLIKSSGVGKIKDITSIVALRIRIGVWIRQNRELFLRRRESSILLKILLIPTVLMRPPQSIQVRLVEVEEVLPVLNVREDDSLLLKRGIANEGVVDGDSAELVVVVIVGSDESVGDVGDVEAAVGLASDVGCGALKVEGVDEVLPEAGELAAKLDFVGDVGLAFAVAYANGLFDPDDVGSSRVSARCWV